MATYDIHNPSYDDIHNACVHWSQNFKLMSVKFDRVVGIARGGLLPAVITSHMLDLPFTPISYSSAAGNGDNKNHTNQLPDLEGRTILVVDDICDTALTLREITDYYSKKGKIVYTAVLHYKNRKGGSFVPDFYWRKIEEDGLWVIYPFERSEKL